MHPDDGIVLIDYGKTVTLRGSLTAITDTGKKINLEECDIKLTPLPRKVVLKNGRIVRRIYPIQNLNHRFTRNRFNTCN